MRNIDLYIEQAAQQDGGEHRTKVYPFKEDGLILVQKTERDFAELQKRIKKCKELGINIPSYIDYKGDGQNCWILEELAPGQELDSMTRNDDITEIFSNLPYEQIEKYLKDVYLLHKNGIGVEPRRRNIFYDQEQGFTTIDVALLSERDPEDDDSVKNVSYFFSMFSSVLLVPFSNDEYGQAVKEKTILNLTKAFEAAHPFFKKYKRWIYRNDAEFAEVLEEHGYNLTLDQEEHKELVTLIESLIDTEVQQKIENPENLFNNTNISYINLLSGSINYCQQFSLFNPENQSLRNYVENSVYSKIKSKFIDNPSDNNLRSLYTRIRKQELDPVNIYPEEYLAGQIDSEIETITAKKM